MSSPPFFKISARDGDARCGSIATRRGSIQTPAFMPVGTKATVKAMTTDAVRQTGAEIILGNCYHLMLRPGPDLVRKLGGLHRFMNWSGPILTDSGGYQVMSLSKLCKISEEGVAFSSHIDGSKHLLTPERSVEIQHMLESDILMVFDECTPWPVNMERAEESMRLSLRWAERSRRAFDRLQDQEPDAEARAALFGIQQGSSYQSLRQQSAQALIDIGFDGYAIGGLAVGEGQEIMFATLDHAVGHLPDHAPRYLMGVGKPDDVIGAVMRGIDMFDCVLPTRSGRNGQAFTRDGPVNLRNAMWKDRDGPLDSNCSCPACKNYSSAYLHHLILCKEILAAMLITWHNLQFYQDLMQALRLAIQASELGSFANDFLMRYRSSL